MKKEPATSFTFSLFLGWRSKEMKRFLEQKNVSQKKEKNNVMTKKSCLLFFVLF